MNRLYYGDNLAVLRDRANFPDACVDLIYLDPPFNSKRDYNLLFKSPKAGGTARSGAARNGPPSGGRVIPERPIHGGQRAVVAGADHGSDSALPSKEESAPTEYSAAQIVAFEDRGGGRDSWGLAGGREWHSVASGRRSARPAIAGNLIHRQQWR